MRIPLKTAFSFFHKNRKNDITYLRPLLTTDQVAEMICKTPRWLEEKRRNGTGPVFRYIGKTPVYEQQDLINWLTAIPKIHSTKELYF